MLWESKGEAEGTGADACIVRVIEYSVLSRSSGRDQNTLPSILVGWHQISL